MGGEHDRCKSNGELSVIGQEGASIRKTYHRRAIRFRILSVPHTYEDLFFEHKENVRAVSPRSYVPSAFTTERIEESARLHI